MSTPSPAPSGLDMSGILAQVTSAIGKFIDAATPIAQKAYNLGLLTLQIDAAQILVTGIIAVVASIWLFRWSKRDFQNYKNSKGCDMPVWMFSGLVVFCLWIFAAVQLGNLWIWVKLFSPELWLVHAAIEKVVEVSTK